MGLPRRVRIGPKPGKLCVEGPRIDAIKHREYRTITTKVPGGFKLTRVPLRGKGKAA
jgi:hypothetical protein